MTRSRERRGFALLLVLSVLALVVAIAAEFHTTARADRRAATNARAATRARWGARAGLARALDMLDLAYAVDVRGYALASHGDTLLPPLDFAQPGMIVRVVVLDARARLNLNRAGAEELQRLVVATGLDESRAATIADAVLDWRDPDDFHRARGAEAPTYLLHRPASRPKNAAFDAVEELASVHGVSPQLFGRLAPLLTVHGDGRINVNGAPVPVLRTVPGIDHAAATTIVQRRARMPYRNVFELLATLPAPTRARIDADLGPTLDRLAFGPREVEIVVTATAIDSPMRAELRATALLAGGAAVSLVRVVER